MFGHYFEGQFSYFVFHTVLLFFCHSYNLQDAIESLKERPDISETIWVIGGSEIYASALRSELFHRIYLTEISTPFECDTFFPAINFDEFKEVSEPNIPSEEQREGDVVYKFKIYEKKKSNWRSRSCFFDNKMFLIRISNKKIEYSAYIFHLLANGSW